MAKHRAPGGRRRPAVVLRQALAPALVGTATVATVASVASLATVGTVATGARPAGDAAPRAVSQQVDLKAVITPGSATNWNADGVAGFFGIMAGANDGWGEQFGQDVVIAPFRLVRFWQGPLNIYDALQDNAGERNLVLASGRGSGNASWVISHLANSDDPAEQQLLYDNVWILDNNVDRPNGGYASRLPFFALVGVNPVPTPTDTGAQIIDVGYEYAWNSSVPLYVTNPAGLLNSIIAYAYRYQKQDRTALPDEALQPCGNAGQDACRHYVIAADGTTIVSSAAVAGTTMYVTYEAAGLPMLQPLRDWGGAPGNLFADATEPVLKVLVDASYPDNDPLSDPSIYTPMRLITPADVVVRAVKQLPGAIAEGIDNVTGDTSSATDGAVTPLAAFTGDVPPGADSDSAGSSDEPAESATESAGETGLSRLRPPVNVLRAVAGGGQPITETGRKPVLKPISRPSLSFSPGRSGPPSSLGKKGPVSHLVQSVFGPRPGPVSTEPADEPAGDTSEE